jgi:phosphate-selective porin OprO and OprP
MENISRPKRPRTAPCALRRVVAVAALVTGTQGWAATDDVDARLKALEAEIAALKQVQSEQPKLKADARGVTIASTDGAYSFTLGGGIAQLDSNYYGGADTTSNNDFNIRRLRLYARGQLGDRLAFRVTEEWAGDSATLLDAYADWTLIPKQYLRVGRFKGPVGLERLQSASAITFTERAYPTELVPNRDLGLQLQGGFGGGAVTYAAGAYNGAVDGRNAATRNPDNEFEGGARLFFEPWIAQADSALKGLGFGIAGTHGKKEGPGNNELPRYRAPSQETVFSYLATTEADGETTRWSPQGYYYVGPFGVLAEYASSEMKLFSTATGATEDITNTAWQVTTSFVLTGERASYGGVVPSSPVSLQGGGWGAFELALRITELDIDDDAFPVFANPAAAIDSANSYGIGLNWYLTASVKAVVDYYQTDFDGGATTGDRDDETYVVARLQYSI